jgi:hypothetical protein
MLQAFSNSPRVKSILCNERFMLTWLTLTYPRPLKLTYIWGCLVDANSYRAKSGRAKILANNSAAPVWPACGDRF